MWYNGLSHAKLALSSHLNLKSPPNLKPKRIGAFMIEGDDVCHAALEKAAKYLERLGDHIAESAMDHHACNAYYGAAKEIRAIRATS